MATKRRSLTAGLNATEGIDLTLAEKFIYADKPDETNGREAPPMAEPRSGRRQNGIAVSRVPLTTRIREDFSIALKRASLERQLNGEFPNTMLDILEEALEPWLRTHGYIE